MKPLAVTGVGTLAPFALDYGSFKQALAEPEKAKTIAFSGPSIALKDDKNPHREEASTWLPLARTAECRAFDANALLGEKGHRNLDRLTKYLVVAAKRALEDAEIKRDGAFIGPLGPDDLGLCSATAYGSLDAITELNLVAELEDPRYINPARFPNTVINASAGYVSIWEDLRAPNTTIVNGNTGSIDAVLVAETHLAHRRAKAFLVGGGEVISEPLYTAFRKLGAIAEGEAPWEPGSDCSTGLHLGEGAAYLVVERKEDAKRRNARIRALIAGYGTAFEPPTHEALLLNPTPLAVARAIRAALDDAGLAPDAVSLVVSSVSGLPRYDAAELRAIEQVFGEDVAVVAPKSLFGESFAAASALSMAAAVAWLEGLRPAPLLLGKLPEALSVVLIISMGYYGSASALVMKRAS
ncbi:MAG: beta-ketoacyl synthase N-terminal-like domain-containing protein [Sandaracinaceae bacterium]|nr:beta-ketoacyl synthase N-terminal-like domain-containing protein [Sandaracinaceae bacterium]